MEFKAKNDNLSRVAVWRSGLVEIYDGAIPDGAICVGVGSRRKLFDIVDVLARHSKPTAKDDPATYQSYWLCPGVPEAANSNDALNAIIAFQYQISERLAGHA